MLIEKILEFEVLIRRLHHIIKIAVDDPQIVEGTDVPVRGDLRANRHIGHRRQLTLLHEGKLLGVVLAPLNRPTLFFLELKHVSSLTIDLENVQDPSDVDKAQSTAVTVDRNQYWQRLPKQFCLLSNMGQGKPPQNSTFPPNDQQLLSHCDRTDHVLALLGIVKHF